MEYKEVRTTAKS